MDRLPVFDWLVRYHSDVNLKKCAPYINDDGVFIDPESHKSIEPGGITENTRYKGVLVVSNGTTLKKMLDDGRVSEDAIGSEYSVRNDDDFFDVIEHSGDDGVYMLDNLSRKMVRVMEIKNSFPNELSLSDVLPENFMSHDGKTRHNAGTKTRLFAKIPGAYSDEDVETIILKRTPYNETGMGPVASCDKHGVRRMFIIKRGEDGEGELLIPDKHIVGVHMKYPRPCAEPEEAEFAEAAV